jgi:hypothetical protein
MRLPERHCALDLDHDDTASAERLVRDQADSGWTSHDPRVGGSLFAIVAGAVVAWTFLPAFHGNQLSLSLQFLQEAAWAASALAALVNEKPDTQRLAPLDRKEIEASGGLAKGNHSVQVPCWVHSLYEILHANTIATVECVEPRPERRSGRCARNPRLRHCTSHSYEQQEDASPE